MIHAARPLFAALVALGLAAPALAADRTADDIAKDIRAIPRPKTEEEFKAGGARRAELVAEMVKDYPDDIRLKGLLPQRWIGLAINGKGDVAAKEIDEALAGRRYQSMKLDWTFLKAQALSAGDHPDSEAALKAADEFIKLAPKDRRAPMLLYSIASDMKDNARRSEVEDRLLKDYPDPQIVEMIKSARKMREAVGKPFNLEFTDAIKGETISIQGLKGKVVVVDFWATWCGPCVAEMPKMKTLYAEYKGKGVEFIGVSLDEPKEDGGLDKLKAFVAKNEIGWPQYYQGNGWKSEFSKGWGIDSIPCVFIIDADGKLYSTEARGKLESLIPELLAKRDKPAAGGGQ